MPAKSVVRVVIADDDRDTVVTLAFILGDEGYEVRRAYNGREALEAVEDFEPDAVVLDIGMPDPNGWEVARKIRGMEGGARPLLIAISGKYVKGADRLVTEMAGFDHFCQKPCAPETLLGWLSKLKSQ
jgi:DNA-binding response OmpR family regulator